jgi:peptidoglycan/xylan/chitin deacetylase (PgdA/CDA1 family)
VTILCYHAVRDDWDSQLAVRTSEFAQHCAAPARARTVVDLPTAVAALDRSWRLPRGMAALTFDDGFADFFEHAAPTLARFGLPATMFLVAATLEPGGQAVDWVRPAPSLPLSTLTLDQVRALQDRGVQFQSHSRRHFDLDTLTEDECYQDLLASREHLEDVLGRPVPFLAYPRGRHDAAVRRAAERAGYTHAFSLPESRETAGPYAVPRVGIFRGNRAATLRIKSSRWYLPLRTSPVFPLARRLVDAAGRSGR